MTEACNSLSSVSWGYRENDDFYTLRTLLSHIDRVMAMGGSYLLNVGPDASGCIPAEQAARFDRIGDWYRRMEGCLEDHEPDDFDYGQLRDACIINRKNGKSYFHFSDGIPATGLIMRQYPGKPKKVRLLNSGDTLAWEICYMPQLFKPSEPMGDCLHIHNIPADDYPSEPIVLEIEWDR